MHSDADEGQELKDGPSADLNTHLTRCQGGAKTPRKEEVGFSNPHPPWMIKLEPTRIFGAEPPRLPTFISHKSPILINLFLAYTVSLAEVLLCGDMKNLNLSESSHRVSDSN